MYKHLTLLLCVMLVLVGCSTIPQTEHSNRLVHREIKQQPPFDFMPRDISIVSVGDSLTEGIGDVHELGGYISYLKTDLESIKSIRHANFTNFGINGNRTDQLLKRLKQEHISAAIEDADLVIITIGGNDVMKVFRDNLLGLNINRFVAAQTGYNTRLRQIIETIRTYNDHVAIILVGIYNPFIKWFSDIKEMDEIVDNWNRASSEVIAEFEHASFVPIADIFENNEESLLYTDHFHPNNRGYELISQRIYAYLQEQDLFLKILE